MNAIKFIFNNPSVSGVILDRSVRMSRVRALPRAGPNRGAPQIFSDIVFAEKNYKDGNFSREGYDYYLQLREQLLAQLPAPHVVLHLDVSAKVCYDRIHNLRKRVRLRLPTPPPLPPPRRSRAWGSPPAPPRYSCAQNCEGGIPLDYLAGLEECYQNFVARMRDTGRVLSLPWTDFGANTDVVSLLQGELDAVQGATWRDTDAVCNLYVGAIRGRGRKRVEGTPSPAPSPFPPPSACCQRV